MGMYAFAALSSALPIKDLASSEAPLIYHLHLSVGQAFWGWNRGNCDLPYFDARSKGPPFFTLHLPPDESNGA
jgi:hypothetical protein